MDFLDAGATKKVMGVYSIINVIGIANICIIVL